MIFVSFEFLHSYIITFNGTKIILENLISHLTYLDVSDSKGAPRKQLRKKDCEWENRPIMLVLRWK